MTPRRWEYKLKRLGQTPSFEFQGMIVAPLILKEETENLVAYHIRIPKNVRIPHSYHKLAHEIIVVLDGRGKAHLNREEVRLRAGGVVVVQPRTWHSFSTAGGNLEFLAIASPRVDRTTDLYYE